MSVCLSKHCIETNFREGKSVGSIQNICSFKEVYVSTGNAKENKGIVVICSDIFGNRYKNNQLVADAFAKAGYYVLIPDLFENDAAEFEKFGEEGYFNGWRSKHGFDVTGPIAKSFLEAVHSELQPKYLFSVGHCYGAKLVIQNLTKQGVLTAGAVAHASGTDLEEIKAINKPVLYSCAENDVMFSDDIRHQVQQILKKNKIIYQFDLFSGVSHGYAVRGDRTNPVEKYAMDKTLQDQIYWFDRFSS